VAELHVSLVHGLKSSWGGIAEWLGTPLLQESAVHALLSDAGSELSLMTSIPPIPLQTIFLQSWAVWPGTSPPPSGTGAGTHAPAMEQVCFRHSVSTPHCAAIMQPVQ
jgi:hypothetical protein